MARPKMIHDDKNYYVVTQEEPTITAGEAIRTTLLNRVCWSAVFAGVALAFAVQVVLNLLGAGLGLASLDSYSGPGISLEQFSWTAALWWLVTGIIASFIGGFTAGRLVGEPKKSTACWHGLVSWATCILVIGFLLTTTAAGNWSSMSGPVQIVMDREVMSIRAAMGAYIAPASATPDVSDVAATAQRPSPIAVENIAMASLVSAIALMLGAAAAWFGGGVGTVRSVHVQTPRDRFITRV